MVLLRNWQQDPQITESDQENSQLGTTVGFENGHGIRVLGTRNLSGDRRS